MLIVKILIIVFILLLLIQIFIATFGYKEGMDSGSPDDSAGTGTGTGTSTGTGGYNENDPVICCKLNSANIIELTQKIEDMSTKINFLMQNSTTKYPNSS